MHNAPTPPDGFERWELDLIEDVVRGFLATRTRWIDLAFEDLCQEAALHWWQQRVRYDAERGASRKTFLRRVVKARLLDIEREAKAAKRGGGEGAFSLDMPSQHDPERTLGDLLQDEHQREALAAAIDRARERLTDRQKRVLREYEVAKTKSEAAGRADVSRDTFYAEFALIRQVFRDDGLEEFLR